MISHKILNKHFISTAFICSLLLGCDNPPPDIVKSYRPVQYIQVSQLDAVSKQTFSGIVEAGLDAKLSFRVSGTINKRHVKLGEKVKMGQLLAELDKTDYSVALQQAKASLQQASANQRNQQANYARITRLYENSNASKSDLDRARADAESAKAATDITRKQLESANLQLSYTQLKSPQACSIAELFADTNESVNAGQAVVRINCGQCPKVRVTIPEKFIQFIQTNDQVQVITTAGTIAHYPAIVSEVGIAAASAGTFPVEALLQGDCPDLRTGMSANLQFDFSKDLNGSSGRQLLIPYLSVGQDDAGKYVFVLAAMGDGIYRADRKTVTTGEPAQNGLPILNGLKQGDLIVTAGVRRMLDGMEVKLLAKPILDNN
ncbi:MAG: efflux RND transporter periplasmic adaptor subunit [Gammaproteobacteria bacterium]|nr:efflux RND transporter periplasmic adaptor subunit [Gammaproteobacteria bacterium]